MLANNYNINPYMWEGMATGTYARSTYIPDYVYAALSANGTVNNNGGFNFVVVPSSDDNYDAEPLVLGPYTMD
jgi:hypothetical protein